MAFDIDITNYQYSKRIPKIAAAFSCNAVDDCDEHSFSFSNKIGTGTIRGINYTEGISVMMFDMKLNHDLKLHFKLGRRHPIAFIYSHEGSVYIKSSESEELRTITKNESCIYVPKGEFDYSFVFPKNQKIKIISVSVIRFLFLSKIECDLDTMPEKLQDLFRDTVGKERFFFESAVEPLTVKILAEIFQSTQAGLERKMFIESKSLALVTALLKRFRVEKTSHAAGYKFSNYDIQRVNLAKNTIIENISDVPTVKELAFIVGININKLQKGFKLVFNKSIRQFIISYRMHLALEYLEKGDYNITEIAHKIGYTNKGHFSALFRKEFGILPSSYKTRVFPQVESPLNM